MKILIQITNLGTIKKKNIINFYFTCCVMLFCTYNVSAQGTIGQYIPGTATNGFDSGCGYPNAGSVAAPISATFTGGICGSTYDVTYGGLIETTNGFDITGFTLSNYDIDTAAAYGFRVFYGPQNNSCTVCKDIVVDLGQDVPCGTFGPQPDLSVFGYPVPVMNVGKDIFGQDIIFYQDMCPNTEYFVQYQFFSATGIDLSDPDGNFCAMDDALIINVGPSALGTIVAPGTRNPIVINSATLALTATADCDANDVVLDFTADVSSGCTISFGTCPKGLELEFRATLACTDGNTLDISTGPLINNPTASIFVSTLSGQISLGAAVDVCAIVACDPAANLELYATHTFCEADDIIGDGSGNDEAVMSVSIASILAECTCVPSDVFPGDCNNDGMVNSTDIVYWNYAVGSTGPIRPNATTDCVAQPSPNWSLSFGDIASGNPEINGKHLDCDGNGIINNQDVDVIVSNYDCINLPNDILPGDCNTDGIVNLEDVLYWGLAQGFIGVPRPNASTDCILQACPDWSQLVGDPNTGSPFVNGKYQDGDGNGVIDGDDNQIIITNFGCVSNYTAPTYTSAAPIYRVEPQGINANGKYQYDLYVENGSGTAATAHGLAFTISSDVIPISAVAMSATGSSLHPDEAFAITDGNRCHVALTRTDNLDVICDGPIATFVVEASDIPVGIPFEIDVAFGTKIKADATLDNITGATAFGMYNGFAPNTNSIFLDASVTHEQCNGLGEALIIPSGGIEPYTYLWSNGANNNQVSNLASGIYTVIVIDSNGLNQSLTLQINGQTPIYDANGNLLCGNLCPEYLAPSGITGNGLYSANNALNSDAIIPTGNTAHYKAGQIIELKSGFKVQPDAGFSAEIEDCQ